MMWYRCTQKMETKEKIVALLANTLMCCFGVALKGVFLGLLFLSGRPGF